MSVDEFQHDVQRLALERFGADDPTDMPYVEAKLVGRSIKMWIVLPVRKDRIEIGE